MRYCKIGDTGAASLAAVLPKTPSLRILILRGNEIGSSGALALAAVLPSTKLRTFSVPDNQIEGVGASSLFSAILSTTSLTSIDLSNNKFGDDAFLKKSGFPIGHSITRIDLDSTGFGLTGAQALISSLPTTQQLMTLWISGVHLGDYGARTVASVLSYVPHLVSLSLSSGIGDDGAAAVAFALPSLRVFTTLSLSCNNIGDKGALALSQALANIRHMTELDLACNNIGVDGANALLTSLPTTRALVYLDLRNNNFDEATVAAVKKGLATNQKAAISARNSVLAGDVATLHNLLQSGVSVMYYEGFAGYSLLHYALKYQHREVVRYLLSQPQVHAMLLFQNTYDETAVDVALKYAPNFVPILESQVRV